MDPRGIPFLLREVADLLPCRKSPSLGEGAQHVLEKVDHRFDIAEGGVSAAFGEAVILTQSLQLAVASGNGVEEALREFQRAEAGFADGFDPEPFPFGHEDLSPVEVEVVGNDGTFANILTEGLVNVSGRVSVAIEDLAGVSVDAARLGRDFPSVVEQPAEGCPVPLPTHHSLSGELDGEDRLLEARCFGVEEDPGSLRHA